MRVSRLRENVPALLWAAAAGAVLGQLGLYHFARDYNLEVRPSFEALAHGHLLAALQSVPSYGGSVVERAPFALVLGLWNAGSYTLYVAVAAPCIAATCLLGTWLNGRMRAASAGSSSPALHAWRGPQAGNPGSTTRAPRAGSLVRAGVLALAVANPLALQALEAGHPEELLGSVLCIAAVLLALRGYPGWSGFALGLAIANKEWALVAAGPVLLALAPPRGAGRVDAQRPGGPQKALVRWRAALKCLGAAIVSALAILAPLALVSGGNFVSAARGIASTSGEIFLPWSLWWFVGHHGPPVRHDYLSHLSGYRVPPHWVGPLSHPSIVLAAVALCALIWWARPAPQVDPQGDKTGRTAGLGLDAIGALALVLLVRCMLDTWDASYYMLPGVLALLSWQALAAPRRPPLAALVVTLLAWVSFVWLHEAATPDVQAAFFDAWTVPLAAALALRLLSPARARALCRLPAKAASALQTLGPGRPRQKHPKSKISMRKEPSAIAAISSIRSLFQSSDRGLR